MSRVKRVPWVLLAGALAVIACDKDKNATPPSSTSVSASAPQTAALSLPLDDGPPPAVDANRAIEYVREIVKFGPRPLGSPSHKKVEDYISSHLKGDQVEDDIFTANTPEGKFPIHNIIAKFPGTKDGIIIIASHYDTNYPLRNTSYVGANDGAGCCWSSRIICAVNSATAIASGWSGMTRKKP
jgi:hypothetical protein